MTAIGLTAVSIVLAAPARKQILRRMHCVIPCGITALAETDIEDVQGIIGRERAAEAVGSIADLIEQQLLSSS
jgi:hypothetical protein